MNPETLLRILKDGTVGSYKVALFLSLSHPDKYSNVGGEMLLQKQDSKLYSYLFLQRPKQVQSWRPGDTTCLTKNLSPCFLNSLIKMKAVK